jgi:phosphonate transport system substrate-binding protein
MWFLHTCAYGNLHQISTPMKSVVLTYVLCIAMLFTHAQSVRIATYQYGTDNRIASLRPFAEHLHKKYGYNVSLKSYSSVQTLISAIQKNEVDIALINTFGYLLLEASGKNYPMRPVSILQVKEDQQDGYRTAIIAGPQVSASRLADLKKLAPKLRLTLVNTGSTSGNLVPRLGMAEVGITSPEHSFKSVMYSDIHDAAIHAVADKMADVAAVGYSEYSRFMQQDITNKTKMRLLWLSPEIPFGPIMFNNRFGSAVGGELLRAFLNLHKENPKAFEALKSGWSETKDASNFMSINGSYYNKFKSMLSSETEMQKVLKQFVK